MNDLIGSPIDHGRSYQKLDLEKLKTSPARFVNRELSWLEFNRRVLEEAHNQNHPLFERLRFISIAASNMEEFYMVRVAGLMAQIRDNHKDLSIDGLTPIQQVRAIRHKASALTGEIQASWRAIKEEVKKTGTSFATLSDITPEEMRWLSTTFEQNILPVLTPITIDPSHPFPFIANKGLSIAVELKNKETGKTQHGLVQIPRMLERFIKLPSTHPRYILIEKAIIAHIDHLFPPPLKLVQYATFRVIRDSEMEIEEEAEDLVRTFQNALKRRRRGRVIHLGVHHNINAPTLAFLQKNLEISTEETYPVHGLVGLSDIAELIDDAAQEHLFPRFESRFPERISEFDGNCFAAIKNKDIVIHHPYETFDVVVQFLEQAARDPDVVSIKQTLYRTSENSQIVNALIEAAHAGKSVTALVELKARFDEEANIRWARDMERAGVQVVYGFVDLKTHAKLSLVTRREDDRLISYAHFGTGNYHTLNARIYTDLSYFTCDTAICKDAGLMFNYMTSSAKPNKVKHLSIAPLNLRTTLLNAIDQEIINARDGLHAEIWAKCNAALDPQIIDKLYQASESGVKIHLVVRGVCALRPGIKGLSENIHVQSIIGRFLEHSRIYCFANGKPMPSRKAKVYMSSADLMTRNLSRRIEALVPIENKTVHKQILDQIMVANIIDRKQSWSMNADGSYKRYDYEVDDFCAHDYFMENPSLSGRGKSLAHRPSPPELSLNKTQGSQKSPQEKINDKS